MWFSELINMQPTEIKSLIIEEKCTQFSYSIIHLISHVHIKTNLKGSGIELEES
jgi:hypothetical protein